MNQSVNVHVYRLRILINYLFLILIAAALVVNVVFFDFGTSVHAFKPIYSFFVLSSASLIVLLVWQFGNRLPAAKSVFFLILYLVFSLVAIYFFRHLPSWDIGAVIDATKNYSLHGPFPAYLVAHPINIPYFFILILLNKLVPASSSNFPLFLDFVNCAIVSLSLYLIGLKTNRISPDWGKYYFILSLFFLPFFLYVTIPYTDTFSLIFLALFIFLFDLKINSKNWVKFVLSLLFIGMAAIMKTPLLFVVVASAIALLIDVIKTRISWKSMIFVVPILVFIVCSFSFNKFITYGYLGATQSEIKSASIPLEHWVYMGQSDKATGIYNDEDFIHTAELTKSNGGDISKTKKDLLLQAKQRIVARGYRGNINFVISKFSKIWGQPDFFAFFEGNDATFVNKLLAPRFLSSNTYSALYVVMDVVLTFLLLLVAIGASISIKAADEPLIVLLSKISLLGVAIFLMFWETRSRYLLNSMPLLILVAAYYCNVISGRWRRTAKTLKLARG